MLPKSELNSPLWSSSKVVLPITLITVSSLIVYWFMKKRKKPEVHDSWHVDISDKNIVIVDTAEEWENAYQLLVHDLSTAKVMGLDCEWVTPNPVALLQIATSGPTCVLVRLFKLAPNFPKSLRNILSDKSVLKLGVSVLDDARRLHKDYNILVLGCVDLRHVLKRIRGVYKCKSLGLRGLTKSVLRKDLSKDLNVRCGNWEAEVYDTAQITYAATDAVVGVKIFLQLVSTKLQQSNQDSTVPKRKGPLTYRRVKDFDSQEFQLLPDKVKDKFWNTARALCQGIVDYGYTIKQERSYVDKQPSLNRPSNSKKDDKNAYSTRQSPLWDNCILQAPDGNALCTCDLKKANWYIEKELGDKVSDDPVTVRLRFEPSGRPDSSRNYYLQEKENVCVVCGHDKDYIRKFIVPFEYRRFFPSTLKDHSSHDILLLCPACHRRSCDYDAILRRQLADECQAPLESGPDSKSFLNKDMQKIRSAGRALKLNRNSIPAKRVVELETVLKDFFGCDFISDDLLEQASEIEARQTVDGYIPHGKRVVLHMASNGGLLMFQARWRKHFLDSMEPKYMPAMWEVDHVAQGWSRENS